MINVLISVVLTPIVSRLYDKEEFGVFYIYMSIVTIASLVISGMYPHAIVLPRKETGLHALVKLCLILMLGGVVLGSVVLWAFGTNILASFDGQALSPYMWLIPLGVVITILNLIFINWNIRNKAFKSNATAQVAGSGSNKATQIALAPVLNGAFPGLIYADLCSKTISSIILSSKEMIRQIFKLGTVSWAAVKASAVEFINYPKYILSGNFVNKFTEDIPLYVISSFFGIGAVGAFGFANQMLGIPYNVIGKSIAPVYFQQANELYEKDKEALKQFTRRSYDKMLLLGSLAFGFTFAFGDVFFKWFFSAEWELAGQVAAILSVYYIFKLISSPFSGIYRVVRQESLTLIINSMLAVLRVAGIFIGVYTGSFLWAIGLFAGASLIGYMINNLLVFRAVGIPMRRVLFQTLATVLVIYGGFYLIRMGLNNIVTF